MAVKEHFLILCNFMPVKKVIIGLFIPITMLLMISCGSSEAIKGKNIKQDNINISASPIAKVGSRTTQTATGNFAEYTNTKYSFKINYPKDWVVDDKVNTIAVTFLSPVTDKKDYFRDNFNIIIQDMDKKPINIKKYTKLSKEQISKYVKSSKLVSENDITISGLPGHKLVYSGKQDNQNLKWASYYMVKEKQVYLLTFSAKEKSFDKMIGSIDQLVESFTLK